MENLQFSDLSKFLRESGVRAQVKPDSEQSFLNSDEFKKLFASASVVKTTNGRLQRVISVGDFTLKYEDALHASLLSSTTLTIGVFSFLPEGKTEKISYARITAAV
jgi:hypothetical protein